MSFYKGDLLNHFRRMRVAAQAAGITARLDLETFRLELARGEEGVSLRPQFIAFVDGKKLYTPRFEAGVTRFIGWCPYFNRRWEIASDKLAFKRFAVENGILTPAFWRAPSDEARDVIVKRSASSFAAQIRGPYASGAETSLDRDAGEYFERFTRGAIAKVWYWDAQPVCLETERMPALRGDGHGTVRELAALRLRHRGTKLDIESLARFVTFQGKSLDTVLAKDEELTVEFRYGSPLLIAADARSREPGDELFEALRPQLEDLGARLWNGIPADIRAGTVFTMDAIVDDQSRVWALEMNSNPFIHPAVYEPMLRSLFVQSTAAPRQPATLEIA